MAESKRQFTLGVAMLQPITTPTTEYWSMRNVFWDFTPGTSDRQYIGSEILSPMVSIKYQIGVNWDSVRRQLGVNGGDIMVRLGIIAVADVPLVTVSSSGISDVPVEWHINRNVYRPTWNGNNVTVVKMKTFKFSPVAYYSTSAVIGGGTAYKSGKLNVRLKGKKQFTQTSGLVNTPLLKGYNYFVVYGVGLPGNPLDLTSEARPSIVFDQFVYYKDF